MTKLLHIARIATIGAITLLGAASLSAAQDAVRPLVLTPTSHAAAPKANAANRPATTLAAVQVHKKTATRLVQPPVGKKPHHLVLQVNTNDPAAMNLALNNATNVAQYYKELGETVEIEVVTFGPGLHMLRQDTSPVKGRIEQMALSTPEVSFKACGNTQENMHKAENKDIPIIPQAQVVKSGVVHVMELEEQGWTYVKP
ncbi:hypothetical protein UP10_39400 [Bradyrhizobium sp. LTSPM299]|uniref:DsrE family protein n=1 Tax=Bradyrhizobium sp. LTSPM299 TaxID=1619233 RepID=UPI0005CA7B56|nr:DsrE family protein [Bradyrhizobium sp. LTSPM299]KJC55395.1 hypothetical protein UP10_39400 [Bradyrhizobium sp. LTSPM299]